MRGSSSAFGTFKGIILAVLAAMLAVAAGCRAIDATRVLIGCPRPVLTPVRLSCAGKRYADMDEPRPSLSWQLRSDERGARQTAYRVMVATSDELLRAGKPDLWDSGKVLSSRTTGIVYAGKPLASRMECHWMARVWDQRGVASPWNACDVGCWRMGLLRPGDWQADWIGMAAPERPENPMLAAANWIWLPGVANPAKDAAPGVYGFRRVFELPAGRRLKRAVLCMAADNRLAVTINGTMQTLASSMRKAPPADVTKALKPGRNVMAARVVNTGNSPNAAGLIGTLCLTFDQGPDVVIATDEKWTCVANPPDGWTAPDFKPSGWASARPFGRNGIKPWGMVGDGSPFLPPSPYLRGEFKVAGKVRRATLYATALGLYDLRLNGERVGVEDWLRPGWMDYFKRIPYQAYDVTRQIRQGANALGAILADGWFAGYVGPGLARELYGKRPLFRVQLEIEYEDGTRQTVATGPDWRAAHGGVLEADLLMGETFDARREPIGWDRPGFNDAAWSPVEVDPGAAKGARMVAHNNLAESFLNVRPKSVSEPKPGVFVFDMGRYVAGVARLEIKGKPGDRVTIKYGERLNPDGTVYTANLRDARATDSYVCRGNNVGLADTRKYVPYSYRRGSWLVDGRRPNSDHQTEPWEPRFTYHGFQYVQLEGYPGKPDANAIEGVSITAAGRLAGRFECSDPVANRLFENIRATMEANFIEVPTDCPQRDERLGWTGDAQVFARSATYLGDVEAFYKKWLVEVDAAQAPDGGFPNVAPMASTRVTGTPGWSDAGVIVPWTAYEAYGDKRELARHYDAMARWVELCRSKSQGLILDGRNALGDWLNVNDPTPRDVVTTAYFAHDVDLMARSAEALGKQDDARRYRELFAQARQAFCRAFVAADGKIKGDSQGGYALALSFGLLDDAERARATDRLVEKIRERDWHLSTGFLGTGVLLDALTDNGRADVAYRLFEADTYPSWRFCILQGATSIWERWDGWTPEKGFQNPAMNSFAHYSFGAVAAWMFDAIGGIAPAAPGYDKVLLRPCPGGKLTWANVTYDSIHGGIMSDWKLEDGRFKWKIEIPANVTATALLPTGEPAGVREHDPSKKGHDAGVGLLEGKHPGVTLLSERPGGHVALALESGRYFFDMPWRARAAE
jgi:alpha-L-rhamnosidase